MKATQEYVVYNFTVSHWTWKSSINFFFFSFIYMNFTRLLTSLNLSVSLYNCFYPELRNIIHLNFASTNSFLSSLITFEHVLCSQWLSSDLFLNYLCWMLRSCIMLRLKSSCDKVHSYHTNTTNNFLKVYFYREKKTSNIFVKKLSISSKSV